jgi:excisionase family DNA binding protein
MYAGDNWRRRSKNMIEAKKSHSPTGNTPAITDALKVNRLPGAREEIINNSPFMLTVQDVSRILNVHENTVRRWSNQGVIKSIRLGPRGDRRYKLQDIADYLVYLQSGTAPPKK